MIKSIIILRINLSFQIFIAVTWYFYIILIIINICVKFLCPLNLSLLLIIGLYMADYLKVFNLCPFDCITVVECGELSFFNLTLLKSPIYRSLTVK